MADSSVSLTSWYNPTGSQKSVMESRPRSQKLSTASKKFLWSGWQYISVFLKMTYCQNMLKGRVLTGQNILEKDDTQKAIFCSHCILSSSISSSWHALVICTNNVIPLHFLCCFWPLYNLCWCRHHSNKDRSYTKTEREIQKKRSSLWRFKP